MRPLAFDPWPLAGVGCELGVGGCGLRDGGWGAFALAFAWALAFTSASPANGQRLMANGLPSRHPECIAPILLACGRGEDGVHVDVNRVENVVDIRRY